MAGIYIHIPFCKVKCHYCDFHFSINHQNIDLIIDSMVKEIENRKDYLNNAVIETIYFGGGTPSLLTYAHFNKIFIAINKFHSLANNIECTVECNPDDLTENKLAELKSLGINRLSIGIQSFDAEQLKKLNRAHNAIEATQSVKIAQQAGFNNITIDLMYGLPDTDINYWESQINQAIDLNVSHISAYCLTYEDKTVFGNWLKKKRITPITDEENLMQFKFLIDKLENSGYEQYEISNFAKNGNISKHNSAYWKGKHYIGIGPSAHSFNGHERQWDISNNIIYADKIKKDLPYYEVEVLTGNDKFNEYIMTRLRTKWGLNINFLSQSFQNQYESIKSELDKFYRSGDLLKRSDSIVLSNKGKFIADHIISELFVVD